MKYRLMHRAQHSSRDYLELIPNEAWSVDYISHKLDNGHRSRSITIIDVCTRERLATKSGVSLHAEQFIEVLEELCRVRGAPQLLMCDRSAEFSRRIFLTWASHHRVQIVYGSSR